MIKLSKLSIICLVLASVALFTRAIPVTSLVNKITLDENNLCTYLPPSPGGGISEEESDALPFCNTTTPPVVGGEVNLIPGGFIAKSYFKSEDGYVQYTGTINIEAYNLSSNDQGGQYDSVGAPPGAQCVGKDKNGKEFVKFVNLIEPADKRFCIRCCSDAELCNTSISTEGCPVIIPGTYD